jgi:hypothetical protein
VLASTSLREEGVEGIVTASNRLVTWHLTIWLNTMLQAEQLPACITNLDTCLTQMNAKDFTHDWLERKMEESGNPKERGTM